MFLKLRKVCEIPLMPAASVAVLIAAVVAVANASVFVVTASLNAAASCAVLICVPLSCRTQWLLNRNLGVFKCVFRKVRFLPG